MRRVAHWAGIGSALLLVACAEAGSSRAPAAGSGGGNGAGNSGGNGGERSVAPAGMLAFVGYDQCPDGWSTPASAPGRFVVGVVESDDVGVTVGEPLTSDTKSPEHSHDYSTTIDIVGHGLTGVSGGANGDTGETGEQPMSGTTSSELGPPSIFEKICEKEAEGQSSGDPLPSGSVMFFNTPDCPAGWQLHEDAAGRFVVPVPDGGTPGVLVGEPLSSGDSPTHSHSFEGSITLVEQSIAGTNGSNDRAKKGAHSFSGTADEAALDMPYMQALVCKKSSPALEVSDSSDAIPYNVLAFFDTGICPDGWGRSTEHQGRFLAGLNDDIPVREMTGGDPLGADADLLHSHTIDGEVTVENDSIALLSGCCNDNPGQQGTYEFSTTTSPVSSGIPYIGLLACRRDEALGP